MLFYVCLSRQFLFDWLGSRGDCPPSCKAEKDEKPTSFFFKVKMK